MKYQILVKTRQKTNSVESDPSQPNTLIIKTREAPIENKANLAVIDLLSEYFHIPKTSITIVKGLKSKSKIVEIL